MKKLLIGGGLAIIAAFVLSVAPAHAATLSVPSGTYPTIQSAITAAAAGDTINVAAGTYNEQIIVNKQLTINGSKAGISAGVNAGTRGTEESIVNGGFIISKASQYYGTPVDGTVVDGFTVLGGSGFSGHNNGFSVESSGDLGITIQNNIIQNVTSPDQSEGIETVDGTNKLTIKNNNISHNWRGIYLTPASGDQIVGNIIDSNNGVGVGIGSSGQSNLTISGNVISNNDAEGWGSDTVGTNVVAHNNSFTGNGAGVDWYSGGTINAICNWWGAANGPGTVGPGSGDNVSTHVDFTTWLTTDDLTGPCNGPLPSTVKVTINKFLDDVQATAANASSTSFSMTAAWKGQSFGPDGSSPYTLDATTDPVYQTSTRDLTMGGEYRTFENLPTTCDAGNPYALVGYTTGTTFGTAAAGDPSTTVPDFIGMQSNEFVIVWNKTCPPPTPSVYILKYVDGVQATAGNANSVDFPMLTTFTSTVHGSATDAPYTLGPAGWPGSGPYQASFPNSNVGSNYATHEVTGGSVVGASCTDGKPFALVGYTTGDTLAGAESATPSATVPSFTNLQRDHYAIVWNHLCPSIPPVVVLTTKDQCKNNGWKTLKDDLGKSFKNQGDCVSFVATKGKNKAAGN